MASVISEEEQNRLDAAMILIKSGVVKMVYCRSEDPAGYLYCTFKLDLDAVDVAFSGVEHGSHENN